MKAASQHRASWLAAHVHICLRDTDPPETDHRPDFPKVTFPTVPAYSSSAGTTFCLEFVIFQEKMFLTF